MGKINILWIIMRWNEKEILEFSKRIPIWEGKLKFSIGVVNLGTVTSLSSNSKERYFKLQGNCLFYHKTTSTNNKDDLFGDPIGLFILENFTVNHESGRIFSLVFKPSINEEHCQKVLFEAEHLRYVVQWIDAFKLASYEVLREKLIDLQIRIRDKTGKDLKRRIIPTYMDRVILYDLLCESI